MEDLHKTYWRKQQENIKLALSWTLGQFTPFWALMVNKPRQLC